MKVYEGLQVSHLGLPPPICRLVLDFFLRTYAPLKRRRKLYTEGRTCRASSCQISIGGKSKLVESWVLQRCTSISTWENRRSREWEGTAVGLGLVLRIDYGEFHLGFCDHRSGLVVLDRQAYSHRQLAALLAARADAHKAIRAASAAVVRVVLMLPRLALGNFRARWIGGGGGSASWDVHEW